MGRLDRSRDHMLVAQVYAVEVADRGDRRTKVVRERVKGSPQSHDIADY